MTELSAQLEHARNLLVAGKSAEARNVLGGLVGQFPQNADAAHLLAIACFHTGDALQGLALMRKSVELAPDRRNFWAAYVVTLSRMPQGADAMLRVAEQALQRFPNLAEAWLAVANHLERLGDLSQLRSLLEQAQRAVPDNIEILLRLARCYQQSGQFDLAITLVTHLLAQQPTHVDALRLYGSVLTDAGKIKEASECWERLLSLNSHDGHALFQLLVARRKCCDWREFDELALRMRSETEARLEAGDAPLETPLVSQCVFMDNAYQYKIAKAWADNRRKRRTHLYTYRQPASGDGPPPRITLGYVTDELRDHPIGLLMHDYFKYHNRDRFRVIIYFDHPPDERDEVYQFIESSCEESRLVAGMDNPSLADKIHGDGVDILVDVKGWREPNRLGVFAARPAPIAVAFQGFAGTTGADYLNYIVVDDCVVPSDQAAFYAEKLAYLGRCYQVNPDHQPTFEELRAQAGTRRDHGLPEDAVVLASFNQAYKLDPQMTAVWFEVLRRDENTVLWLLEMNAECRQNLRQRAAESGIDPQRLVFAPWADHRAHMARLTLADLGLDTRVYNGHTTTSEALWCRVPVVTLLGSHFASRVSASILREVGLEELVTHDLTAYRELVFVLIRDAAKRASIRRQLSTEHLLATLFNTRDYVRRTEDLFEQMYDLYRQGLAPAMLRCRL